MRFIWFVFLIMLTLCSDDDNENVKKVDNPKNGIVAAGVRSSSYGIKPFPSKDDWGKTMAGISGRFKGAVPQAIWIVGEIWGDKTCHLTMPKMGDYDNIHFSDQEKHEVFLDYFDEMGYEVFLQVEPADANIETLIEVVMERYGHHSCVAGFGVDVEWFRVSDKPGWGVQVTDSMAKAWENKLKSVNSDFDLFLKHWDYRWMPPSYRGDLIFVDDSQMFDNFEQMYAEFTQDWAKTFHPNPVYFQVGYPKDKIWWNQFDDPIKTMGDSLMNGIDQPVGIIWVDFTLRDLYPDI